MRAPVKWRGSLPAVALTRIRKPWKQQPPSGQFGCEPHRGLFSLPAPPLRRWYRWRSGDNHRLMLLHCSLLLDLTVSKRHSTCVQHIGGLGLMVKYHSGLFSICRSANAWDRQPQAARRYYTALLIHFCFINSFSEDASHFLWRNFFNDLII